MWPEFELFRIQQEEAQRDARERRLVTALRRERQAERLAERRVRRTEASPPGRTWWWTSTRTSDINVRKV